MAPKTIWSRLKIKAFVPTFPCPIWITVPNSLVQTASAMRQSAISTSVRRAKNCALIGRIRPSVPAAIEPAPRIATTARSKRNVPRANRGAASVAAWMRRVWIGCVPTRQLNPTRRPCASARCGSNRSLPRRKTGMACGGSVYDGSGASTVKPS